MDGWHYEVDVPLSGDEEVRVRVTFPDGTRGAASSMCCIIHALARAVGDDDPFGKPGTEAHEEELT